MTLAGGTGDDGLGGARGTRARAGAGAGARGARGGRRGTTRGGGTGGAASRAGGDDGGRAGRGATSTASGGGSSSGTGAGSGGGARAAAGGGGRGTGATSILVLIDTLLDGVGDTGRELVGEVLERLGNLGGDGIGETVGGGLLLLEGGEDLSTGVGLDDLVLLAVEVLDGGLDLLGQVLDGAGKAEGIAGAELIRVLGLVGTLLDGRDKIIGGVLDLGDVAAAVGVDGALEVIDLVADVRDDAGHGGQVALDDAGLTGNTSGSGEDAAGQAQGQEGEGSELHLDEAVTKV